MVPHLRLCTTILCEYLNLFLVLFPLADLPTASWDAFPLQTDPLRRREDGTWDFVPFPDSWPDSHMPLSSRRAQIYILPD